MSSTIFGRPSLPGWPPSKYPNRGCQGACTYASGLSIASMSIHRVNAATPTAVAERVLAATPQVLAKGALPRSAAAHFVLAAQTYELDILTDKDLTDTVPSHASPAHAIR